MNKYDGHTPGPFSSRQHATSYGIRILVESERKLVAELHGEQLEPKGVSIGEAEANARLFVDAPTILAQRDEAVALLRRASEWICSLPSIPDNEGAATMLVTRINDFLSGLDSKGNT